MLTQEEYVGQVTEGLDITDEEFKLVMDNYNTVYLPKQDAMTPAEEDAWTTGEVMEPAEPETGFFDGTTDISGSDLLKQVGAGAAGVIGGAEADLARRLMPAPDTEIGPVEEIWDSAATAVSGWLGGVAKDTKGAGDSLSERLTPETKEANRKFQEGEGIDGLTLHSLVNTAAQAVGSMGPVVPTFFMNPVAGTVATAALFGPSMSDEAYSETEELLGELSESDLRNNEGFKSYLKNTGGDFDKAKKLFISDTAASRANIAGAVGTLTAPVYRLMGAAAGGKLFKFKPANVVAGAGIEGFQEAGENLPGDLYLNNEVPEVELDIVDRAVKNAVAGTAGGGALATPGSIYAGMKDAKATRAKVLANAKAKADSEQAEVQATAANTKAVIKEQNAINAEYLAGDEVAAEQLAVSTINQEDIDAIMGDEELINSSGESMIELLNKDRDESIQDTVAQREFENRINEPPSKLPVDMGTIDDTKTVPKKEPASPEVAIKQTERAIASKERTAKRVKADSKVKQASAKRDALIADPKATDEQIEVANQKIIEALDKADIVKEKVQVAEAKEKIQIDEEAIAIKEEKKTKWLEEGAKLNKKANKKEVIEKAELLDISPTKEVNGKTKVKTRPELYKEVQAAEEVQAAKRTEEEAVSISEQEVVDNAFAKAIVPIENTPEEIANDKVVEEEQAAVQKAKVEADAMAVADAQKIADAENQVMDIKKEIGKGTFKPEWTLDEDGVTILDEDLEVIMDMPIKVRAKFFDSREITDPEAAVEGDKGATDRSRWNAELNSLKHKEDTLEGGLTPNLERRKDELLKLLDTADADVITAAGKEAVKPASVTDTDPDRISIKGQEEVDVVKDVKEIVEEEVDVAEDVADKPEELSLTDIDSGFDNENGQAMNMQEAYEAIQERLAKVKKMRECLG